MPNELIAPHGEHLAHLLAWAIGFEMLNILSMSLEEYHRQVQEMGSEKEGGHGHGSEPSENGEVKQGRN